MTGDHQERGRRWTRALALALLPLLGPASAPGLAHAEDTPEHPIPLRHRAVMRLGGLGAGAVWIGGTVLGAASVYASADAIHLAPPTRDALTGAAVAVSLTGAPLAMAAGTYGTGQALGHDGELGPTVLSGAVVGYAAVVAGVGVGVAALGPFLDCDGEDLCTGETAWLMLSVVTGATLGFVAGSGAAVRGYSRSVFQNAGAAPVSLTPAALPTGDGVVPGVGLAGRF